MRKTWAAFISAAGLAAAANSAEAAVLYGTYSPSDTPATSVNNFMPLEYRSPEPGRVFKTAGGMSSYCANLFCTWIQGEGVTTDFVAPRDFTASHMVVAVSGWTPWVNRYGFSISRWNTATNAWDGLGYMQFHLNNIPMNVNAIVEVEAPLGESGAGFVDFNYKPIQFSAGSTYRITGSGWAGGTGTFLWHGSAKAAAPGQSVQHTGYQAAFGLTQTNLAWQPAFAFTDGGSLAAVPEPATWGLLIGGFGVAGAAMRRYRRAIA